MRNRLRRSAGSVRVLEHQVATQLHLRQGKATTNFAGALPAPDSELAQEMLRDPYDLSFLPGERIAEERDLEDALLADIVKFMLELGGGLTSRGGTSGSRSAAMSSSSTSCSFTSSSCATWSSS